MGIRAQRLDDRGLYLEASNGNSVLITPTILEDTFSTTPGTGTARENAATRSTLNRIVNALGSDQISAARLAGIIFDWASAEKRITAISINWAD